MTREALNFHNCFLELFIPLSKLQESLNARSNHVAHNVRLPDVVAAWQPSFFYFRKNEDRKIKVSSHRKPAIAFDSCYELHEN
jgi:hypothetical protein